MKTVLHIVIWLTLLTLSMGRQGAWAQSSSSIIALDVENSETSFLVDPTTSKIKWIKSECAVEFEVEPQKTNKKHIYTTKKTSKSVRIGPQAVSMNQQFRLNLELGAESLDVFSSVRGGWSSVPVKANRACTMDATCRLRTELPPC